MSATLLFDQSGSMAGYVKSGDSRFVGVVSAFENLPEKVNIRFYGIKEDTIVNRKSFDEKLLNGDIQWSNESNLIDMVKTMVKHIDGGDDVCFLVTDGILSGSNKEINESPEKKFNIIRREAMMNEVKTALSSSKDSTLSALVVRYKSSFNGTYSCYNNDTRKISKKDRPFFVFVIGKWSAVKYIEQELIARKEDKSSLSTSYMDIYMLGDISFNTLQLKGAVGLEPSSTGLHILKDYSIHDEKDVEFTAEIDMLPDYMKDDDYFIKNASFQVKFGDKPAVLLEEQDYSLALETVSGVQRMRLKIKASKLRFGNDDCTLIFRLKNVKPNWIAQRSDDDDLDILTGMMKMEKTFNLKYFVEGFTVLNKSDYVKEQTILISCNK